MDQSVLIERVLRRKTLVPKDFQMFTNFLISVTHSIKGITKWFEIAIKIINRVFIYRSSYLRFHIRMKFLIFIMRFFLIFLMVQNLM